MRVKSGRRNDWDGFQGREYAEGVVFIEPFQQWTLHRGLDVSGVAIINAHPFPENLANGQMPHADFLK